MEDYDKYLKFILNFLSYRQRSEKEIRDKLTEREASPEITSQIITFLQQHKLLDDKEFARSWVRSRQSFRPKSKRAIKMELLKKGIAPETAEEALEGNEDEEGINDTEQALKLIQKRIIRYKGLPKPELYQKLGGFLARRGFSWETIKTCIDQCYQNNENDNS
jgi:regulatory protein